MATKKLDLNSFTPFAGMASHDSLLESMRGVIAGMDGLSKAAATAATTVSVSLDGSMRELAADIVAKRERERRENKARKTEADRKVWRDRTLTAVSLYARSAMCSAMKSCADSITAATPDAAFKQFRAAIYRGDPNAWLIESIHLSNYQRDRFGHHMSYVDHVEAEARAWDEKKHEAFMAHLGLSVVFHETPEMVKAKPVPSPLKKKDLSEQAKMVADLDAGIDRLKLNQERIAREQAERVESERQLERVLADADLGDIQGAGAW